MDGLLRLAGRVLDLQVTVAYRSGERTHPGP